MRYAYILSFAVSAGLSGAALGQVASTPSEQKPPVTTPAPTPDDPSQVTTPGMPDVPLATPTPEATPAPEATPTPDVTTPPSKAPRDTNNGSRRGKMKSGPPLPTGHPN